MQMTKALSFVCRECGTFHKRRNLAVECCSRGDALTTDELEAIGQQRLFGDSTPAVFKREPIAVSPGEDRASSLS